TVITDQVVAPRSHPSIRVHTTSSIRPETPDAMNRRDTRATVAVRLEVSTPTATDILRAPRLEKCASMLRRPQGRGEEILEGGARPKPIRRSARRHGTRVVYARLQTGNQECVTGPGRSLLLMRPPRPPFERGGVIISPPLSKGGWGG